MRLIKRLIASLLLVPFLTAMTPFVRAAEVAPWMPPVGIMVHLSAKYEPALMVGIQLDSKDPFRFNFLIERGQKDLSDDTKREEYRKLVKYFLASLTIPNEDMWVNLSPYEHDRIIPDDFGLTEMGRDLLAQDYLLKQITSSLIHPQEGAARDFWQKVYQKVYEKYGTTDIPVDTFNKVWIVPDTATIFHRYDTALVVENHLKVMMEQDYLALEKNQDEASTASPQGQENGLSQTAQFAAQVVREIVIPLLEKEVNEGEHFAPLRQVYSAMLLATWFKKSLKESLLGQVYADKGKVAGVNLSDPGEKEDIYQKYLQAYKVGVFNFIKEDLDPLTQEVLPRKYFSGGTKAYRFDQAREVDSVERLTPAQRDYAMKTETKVDQAAVVLDAASRTNGSLGKSLNVYRSLAGGLVMAAGLMLLPSPDVLAASDLKPAYVGQSVARPGQGNATYSGSRINEYADQLSANASNPTWRVFVVDLPAGEKDLSQYKALHLKMRGEGNFIVQIIDGKRKDKRGTDNVGYGFSDVFHVGSDGYVVIDLKNILKNQPDLNLRDGARVVVITGRNAGSTPINLKDEIRVEQLTFSTERPARYSAGVPFAEHVASIENMSRRDGDRARAFETFAQQASRERFHNEFAILQTATLSKRNQVLEGLVEKLDSSSKEERDQSYHVLSAELFNPAGNTNGRRYIYNAFKDHNLPVEENILEGYIVGQRVKKLIVLNAPYFAWNKDKRRDYHEYPEWSGRLVTTRRYVASGVSYGVEGSIVNKDTVERLVDANMLEDWAYWARVTAKALNVDIDPLVVFAFGYTETQLGITKDDNILQIHDQDTIRPQDIKLRQQLLEKYSRPGEDVRRASVAIDAIVFMETQLGIFSRLSKTRGTDNGEILARILQRYNGYGHNPLLGNEDMGKNPVMGRRTVAAAKSFSTGSLMDIIRRVDAQLGYKGQPRDWNKVDTTRFPVRSGASGAVVDRRGKADVDFAMANVADNKLIDRLELAKTADLDALKEINPRVREDSLQDIPNYSIELAAGLPLADIMAVKRTVLKILPLEARGRFKESMGLVFGTMEGNSYRIARIVPVQKYATRDDIWVTPARDEMARLIEENATGGVQLLGAYHTHFSEPLWAKKDPGPSQFDRLGEDILLPEYKDRIAQHPIGIVFEPKLNLAEISIAEAENVIPSDINMFVYIPNQKISTGVISIASISGLGILDRLASVVDASPQESDATADKAMLNNAPGGIDFNAGLLNMNIKRDGVGMPLPLPMQDPALMNIEGLSPTILEIAPAKAMPIFSEVKQLERSPATS